MNANAVDGANTNGVNGAAVAHRTIERQLGDTEASYYLPARESGVNDMYLHLGFEAPAALVQRSRVRLVWAILRARHPLLAARVDMRGYDDIRFVYDASSESSDALASANRALEYRVQDKDALIDSYLNGPRTLGNDRLSYLIVSYTPTSASQSSSQTASDASSDAQAAENPIDVSLLICATHFLGDGMALHQFANHFFGLLGGPLSEPELEAQLESELRERWGGPVKSGEEGVAGSDLPRALEDRIPDPTGSGSSKLRRAICKVDFENSQRKFIGGHAFPREGGKERHTVVPTVPFGAEKTKVFLRCCKSHGVSISAAVFALCNLAWHRTVSAAAKAKGKGDEGRAKPELPIMMYSALNLRPYLTPPPNALEDSYWYIAIGYFNVVLPSFFPAPREELVRAFWHRARGAKEQSAAAARHPRLLERTREMAAERGRRARVWAREDDERAAGTWKPEPKPEPKPEVEKLEVNGDATPKPAETPALPKAPSVALMGLSLLGNLDGMYKHDTFGAVRLHTLTTGSRQRAGGMLLFAYTFVGKLWLSLGYDENGFEREAVEGFWRNLLGAADELLTT